MRALGILVLLLVAAASTTHAAVAPDSAQRAALEARIGRAAKVRLLAPEGPIIMLEPTVREDGIGAGKPYHPPRPALIVVGEVRAAQPVDFVPWSRIEGVQVRTSAARGGAVLGALVGLALVGAGVRVLQASKDIDWADGRGQVIGIGAGIVGAGALAGFALGSLGEDWKTVYPPPGR